MPDEPASTSSSEALTELADELVARGQGRAPTCVELSELSEVANDHDLSEDDTQALAELLEERGFDVRDDCGRNGVEQTSYNKVELAKAIERGDLAAKERLVNSNLRLVISNARKYEGFDLSLLDLIQEGILG